MVREHFHGQLTYASGPWENVAWDVFDIVGIDYYREKLNKNSYREKLAAYFKHGKPVVVLEFGAFLFTFVMPSYPFNENPLYDLDMASYSVVKTYTDHNGTTYKDMPWEPKKSFTALDEYYANQ